MEKVKSNSSIILVGHSHTLIEEINNNFKQDVNFFSANEKTDVTQVGNKFSQAVLLFTEPHSCIEFLRLNEHSAKPVNVHLYLVMDRNGKFKAETEIVLKHAGVQICIPKQFNELLEDLRSHLLSA